MDLRPELEAIKRLIVEKKKMLASLTVEVKRLEEKAEALEENQEERNVA